ncbi:hypothetical protein EV363DRAFT_518856 [Boletus edulis]|nr:hypothetical protein EV363DRAFT_518856 [Boletus edulis]
MPRGRGQKKIWVYCVVPTHPLSGSLSTPTSNDMALFTDHPVRHVIKVIFALAMGHLIMKFLPRSIQVIHLTQTSVTVLAIGALIFFVVQAPSKRRTSDVARSRRTYPDRGSWCILAGISFGDESIQPVCC